MSEYWRKKYALCFALVLAAVKYMWSRKINFFIKGLLYLILLEFVHEGVINYDREGSFINNYIHVLEMTRIQRIIWKEL